MDNDIVFASEPIVKRGPGRPRKYSLPCADAFQASVSTPQYQENQWYLYPEDHTEKEFLEYLDQQRARYASGSVNPELIVYEDDLVRRSAKPPSCSYGFTPEGLLRLANSYRGPYMHAGHPTPGALMKTRVLLARDRLIAGTTSNREPDISKLKDFLSPIWWSLIHR